ncbi:hypothetical protein C8Q78DRAFT_1080897 [Trametes maxima]|nr:hypothetical protein C8Q78DRAFT_1080897 [Trametes maxima]
MKTDPTASVSQLRPLSPLDAVRRSPLETAMSTLSLSDGHQSCTKGDQPPEPVWHTHPGRKSRGHVTQLQTTGTLSHVRAENTKVPALGNNLDKAFRTPLSASHSVSPAVFSGDDSAMPGISGPFTVRSSASVTPLSLGDAVDHFSGGGAAFVPILPNPQVLFSRPASPEAPTFADKAVVAKITKDVSVQARPSASVAFKSFATVKHIHGGGAVTQAPITGSPVIGLSGITHLDPPSGTRVPRPTELTASPLHEAPLLLQTVPLPIVSIPISGHLPAVAQPQPGSGQAGTRSLFNEALGPVSVIAPARSRASSIEPGVSQPQVLRALPSGDSTVSNVSDLKSSENSDTEYWEVVDDVTVAGDLGDLHGLDGIDAAPTQQGSTATGDDTIRQPEVPPTSPTMPTTTFTNEGDMQYRADSGFYYTYYGETIVPPDVSVTRRGKTKYIVVIAGWRVGVFRDWLHAAPHVNHCPGAKFKGFKSYTEAIRVYYAAKERGDVEVVDP